MSNQPTWQFSPRGIGVEVIQDSASAHFRDDPIRKLVREALQNSLDAKEPGLASPVEVSIGETKVDADLIGAAELRRHLTACRNRAKEANHPKVQAVYDGALQTLSTEQIRCLQIVDSGTRGLKGNSWDALVTQEGSVFKEGDAPGGSNGIGKNAALNVSDLRTVFYSTRYSAAREGRVEKLQGKATLMSHPDPDDSGNSLQHIGFFAMPDGQPVYTREIPDFFKLGAVGAGVFVMGFNPRSAEWVKEVTAAVIENFFYAVHHKNLVVKVAAPEADGVVVNHETLDWLFESYSAGKPSHYYYKAIRDRQPLDTDAIGKIGPLQVFLALGAGPRRIAYINHNGMLITDSREQKANPVAPRGRSLWPDFAAVVTPTTVAGDEWVRQTENPSHDAMSPWQLEDDKERRAADGVFREVRATISKIIDDAAEVEKYGDTSNLMELAELFPDEFDPSAPGNAVLPTRTTPITPIRPSGRVSELQIAYETMLENTDDTQSGGNSGDGNNQQENGGGNGGGGGGEGGSQSGNDLGKKSREKRERQARPPRLRYPRFLPTGPAAATVAFTVAENSAQEVSLALTPAGGEWLGQESHIAITDAKVISPQGQEARIADGVVSLTPRPNERVVIEIAAAAELDGLAFRIG